MAYSENALYVDSVAHAAVTQFAISTAYTVGQIRRQLAAPAVGSERCFVCIVAGTSAASEPAWVLTKGAKTVSGTATFQECTALPGLNKDSTNTNAWAASKGAIALGVVIKNTAATHYFICTTAGTGGTGSEPSWNTTTGATTADGSVTWTCLGAVGSFTNWGAAGARLTHVVGTTWLVTAFMIVFVGDDHNETTSAGATVAHGNSCSILCIDHTVALPAGASNLKTTAAITDSSSTGITFLSGNFPAYVYGLQIITTYNAGISNLTIASGAVRFRFEQCQFKFTGASNPGSFVIGSANISTIEFKGCTFQYANTTSINQSFNVQRGAYKFEDCALAGVWPTATLFSQAGTTTSSSVLFEGCDLSSYAAGTLLAGSNTNNGYWCFKDCKLSSAPIISAISNDNVSVDVNRCDTGGTNYRNERYALNADETTSITVVRTGGASDGVTAVSHRVATTSSANNSMRVFNALPLATWNAVTGSNRNVTLYGMVNDSRVPNNDELWFDVEYLGSASSPRGSFATSEVLPLAAGAALTADTSAWDTAATARANTTAYVVGAAIKVASNAGRVFICTTAGTSASSVPGGYASAVDGGSVTDGTAVFRAACRFKQTVTLSSPQPAQIGYLYAYPKFGRASTTYYLDPKIELS